MRTSWKYANFVDAYHHVPVPDREITGLFEALRIALFTAFGFAVSSVCLRPIETFHPRQNSSIYTSLNFYY